MGCASSSNNDSADDLQDDLENQLIESTDLSKTDNGVLNGAWNWIKGDGLPFIILFLTLLSVIIAYKISMKPRPILTNFYEESSEKLISTVQSKYEKMVQASVGHDPTPPELDGIAEKITNWQDAGEQENLEFDTNIVKSDDPWKVRVFITKPVGGKCSGYMICYVDSD
eukprot:104249_1